VLKNALSKHKKEGVFMHRLIINKLGPISHAKLDCNQFMVLTGCQASGKSTIAKALFYFRTVKDDILLLLIKKTSGLDKENDGNLKKTLENWLREKFLNVFGSSWGMDNEMYIEYHYKEEVWIRVHLVEDKYYDAPNFIKIAFSSQLFDIIVDLDKTVCKAAQTISDEDIQIIKKELSDDFDDEYSTVFIPAGRSMITLLATQLNYIYSTMADAQKRSIDFRTRSYLENIIKIRPEFEDGLWGLRSRYAIKARKKEVALNFAVRKINKVLKGSYRYNNGDERLEIDGNHYVKINFTSSGQQESVWILNLLFYYLLQAKPTFLIIEEPESHLFPEAQKEIVELISLVYNSGHSMLVTTHSPYVLGTLNNLIFASQFDNDLNSKVGKVVNKRFWITKEDIVAWFVRKGTIKNCIDEETGMIENELIDEISGVINEDFDKMVTILHQEEAGE
jgi:predicted ATP-dependent endonuclease of OLD family